MWPEQYLGFAAIDREDPKGVLPHVQYCMKPRTRHCPLSNNSHADIREVMRHRSLCADVSRGFNVPSCLGWTRRISIHGIATSRTLIRRRCVLLEHEARIKGRMSLVRIHGVDYLRCLASHLSCLKSGWHITVPCAICEDV